MALRLALFFFPALLFPSGAPAATVLTIDKLERAEIAEAAKEVSFSAFLEGTVADPELQVFVFVHQPRLGGWRIFPATVDTDHDRSGGYRWRAICQFGELSGKGKGDTYLVRAYAFDRLTVSQGLPPSAVEAAIKTEIIALKRVR